MEAPLNPGYTRYHPKWYRRRMPIFWWLGKAAYTRFITRELTSLFVAYAALYLVVLVVALGRGEAEYARLQAWAAAPAVLVWHAVVLLALLYHTITWLNLAPQALVVTVGRHRVPSRLVLAVHYAAWLAVSALLVWLVAGR